VFLLSGSEDSAVSSAKEGDDQPTNINARKMPSRGSSETTEADNRQDNNTAGNKNNGNNNTYGRTVITKSAQMVRLLLAISHSPTVARTQRECLLETNLVHLPFIRLFDLALALDPLATQVLDTRHFARATFIPSLEIVRQLLYMTVFVCMEISTLTFYNLLLLKI